MERFEVGKQRRLSCGGTSVCSSQITLGVQKSFFWIIPSKNTFIWDNTFLEWESVDS